MFLPAKLDQEDLLSHKDKRPLQYRTFMNERRWMYELARTQDGVFGWGSTWNACFRKQNPANLFAIYLHRRSLPQLVLIN